MEEKLKTFGELLKETIGNRSELTDSGSETVLEDATRDAILEKVVQSKPNPSAQPPSAEADATAEDSSTIPFGVLLERTVKIRSEMDKTEHDADDKIREAVIEKSKIALVEDIMRGLIR